jgi:hypothetical protein
MAIEIKVKQKPHTLELRGGKDNRVMMTIKAESVVVAGLTLSLHHAVVSVGGELKLAEKGGFQLTEPRTGYKVCGGERETRMAVMNTAERLIKSHGGAEAVMKLIESKEPKI